MTTKELEEKYGYILNDWSEELRIEQDEETIYYTREQKKELFINLEELGYTKEELSNSNNINKTYDLIKKIHLGL